MGGVVTVTEKGIVLKPYFFFALRGTVIGIALLYVNLLVVKTHYLAWEPICTSSPYYPGA